MKFLTENWDLKLLALFAAILLWFFVVGIENTVYLLPDQVEVKVTNLGKNLGLATVLPDVKVYIKTDQNLLKSLNKNNFQATIDLKDLTQGDYRLPVQIACDNAGVTVLQTVPDKISVHLAPLAEKNVRVDVSALGKPKDRYSLKEITVAEKNVKISGAQNLLDKIDSVNAQILLDGTETNSVEKNVVLVIPQIFGLPKEGIVIEPDQIVASVVIEPSLVQKTVKISPQFTDSSGTQQVIDALVIDPGEVMVEGDSKAMQGLEQIKTYPVSAEALMKRLGPLEVGLVIPEGVKLSDPKQKITLFLKKAPGTMETEPVQLEPTI